MRFVRLPCEKKIALTGFRLAAIAVLCLNLVSICGVVDGHAFELFGNKFFEDKALAVADPVYYTVKFSQTGLAAEEETDLRAASQLAEDEDKPVSGAFGLVAKARSDRDRLIGALYEQARYDGVVSIKINGTYIDDLPPAAELKFEGKVPVLIEIEAGKVFRFGKVRFSGDTAGSAPSDFGLVEGAIAKSTIVIDAEDGVIQKLRENGHALAKVVDTQVEADHKEGVLDVAIDLEAGPVAAFGVVSVEGTQTVDPDFVTEQAGLLRGQTYSPQELAAARKRIRALEVFETISFEEGDRLDANRQLPVTLKVKERKLRYFGVGATYSNTDGAGIEGYWGHRNLFGRAEKLRIEGSVSRLLEATEINKLNFNTAILFEKPGIYGPKASFNANARAVQENYDAFSRRSVRGGGGIAYKYSDQSEFSAGADLDLSRIVQGMARTEHLIASVPLTYSYDGSDDKLDPMTGMRFKALVEPSNDFKSSSSFIKARADGSTYFTLNENESITFAALASMGTIAGASLAEIPADRRFYAGGGGSIRGYAFQSVGPVDANGKPTGGSSLFQGSLEARLRVTDKVGIVPFIDAGVASANQFPVFSDMRYGAGLGLRYKTPFGPLRLDAGVPINRQDGEDGLAVYAGIGQAF